MESTVAAALCAALFALGAATGAYVVPRLADEALGAKKAAYARWWGESTEGYAQWMAEHEGGRPRASAPGREGALGTWAADAVRLARQGSLSKERYGIVSELGLTPHLDERGAGEGLLGQAELDERYGFSPGRATRALMGALLGALFAASAVLPQGGLGTAASCALCSVCLAICVCDLRARVIPTELTLVAAALSIAFTVTLDPAYIVDGVACAALFGVGCALIVRGFRAAGRPDVLGAGDARLIPALALASSPMPFTYAAAATCAAFVAATAVRGAVRRDVRGALREPVPFAPVICAWGVLGAAISATFAACGM